VEDEEVGVVAVRAPLEEAAEGGAVGPEHERRLALLARAHEEQLALVLEGLGDPVEEVEGEAVDVAELQLAPEDEAADDGVLRQHPPGPGQGGELVTHGGLDVREVLPGQLPAEGVVGDLEDAGDVEDVPLRPEVDAAGEGQAPAHLLEVDLRIALDQRLAEVVVRAVALQERGVGRPLRPLDQPRHAHVLPVGADVAVARVALGRGHRDLRVAPLVVGDVEGARHEARLPARRSGRARDLRGRPLASPAGKRRSPRPAARAAPSAWRGPCPRGRAFRRAW
jgi:hypothetical protein